MNEYSVELSPDAQADVAEIRDYIRNVLKNEKAADRFLEDTLDAVDSLESFPYDHMVRTDPAHVGSVEKRQFNYRKNYCMFYIVKEERKLVRVLKVSYTGRDFDRGP